MEAQYHPQSTHFFGCMCPFGKYLGPGLLTRSILDAGARRVVVVEKDSRFVPTLQVCHKRAKNGHRHLDISIGSPHSNRV